MAQIEIIPESIQLIRMSDEEYFSDKYKDYISNSKLGLLNPAQGGSIEKYHAGYASSYSESFELGSVVHQLILQPGEFRVSPLDKPSGKLGLFILEVLEARKKGLKITEAIDKAKIKADYYANSLSPTRIRTAMKTGLQFYLCKARNDRNRYMDDNLIYVSERIREKYLKCMESLRNNSDLMNKLNPEYLLEPNEVYNEYAILCEIGVTLDDGSYHKLKIKGKLDNFTIDYETQRVTLNDLKTTGRPVSYFMGNYIYETDSLSGEKVERWINGSFQKYHYHRQIALYLWLLSAAMKHLKGITYELHANMLLVETFPEFNTRVCAVNGIHIQKGLQEFKELIVYLIENGQQRNS